MDRGQRQALLDNPADAMALQQAGFQAASVGDWQGALRLLLRAARLHGDQATLERQVDRTLTLALEQALVRLQAGAVEAAAAILDSLALIRKPEGDFAFALGILRLIQGRDEEAARLNSASGREDSGLAVALAGIARHRADNEFIGTVVIPVFKMADTIERALDSVLAAAAFYRRASNDPHARIHICIVDDASPDDTVAQAFRWARAHPEQSTAIIANNRNRGAGRSRNAGAAAALGRYLWFLDADDWYLEPHLFLTASTLDHAPDAGFVRTGMLFDRIDQEITPAWREASENSYPCNLCVRRECHDFTGGFPEEAPFHPAVADDVAYGRALHSLFGGIKLTEKTVHYTMRDDNALARQRAEMTGGGRPEDRGPPDARFLAIELLTQRRIQSLKSKMTAAGRSGGWAGPRLLPADGPPTAAALIEKGREELRVGRLAHALAVLRRAAALAPDNATAWFELGMAAHRLQNPLALRAFRTVACLHPDAAPARFNLASMLFDGGLWMDALTHLRGALILQPGYANALHLLGRAAQRLGRTGMAQAAVIRAARLEPAHPDVAALCAETALKRGDPVAAARHGRRSLALSPDLFEGQVALAKALEALHRSGEALAGWERAIRCNPGLGEAFTRRAVNLLARSLGPAPQPRPAAAAGRRLASTPLGRHGRFGNQLLQYGVLRLYAARHGLTLEVPPWPGRHLYGLDDPLPGPALPLLPEAEGEAAVVASLQGADGTVLADRDITGYFCGSTAFLAPHRDAFRAFFTEGPRLRPYADGVAGRLRAEGRTVVALHLRRGDFGWGRFWIAPEGWYLRWLEEIWPGLDRPILYIATDDPGCRKAFAAYRPLCARDLAEPIAGAEFFTDFHALCQADLVAISNSSFSFTATMLNRTARSFHRPDRSREALVPYDPWNSPVLL